MRTIFFRALFLAATLPCFLGHAQTYSDLYNFSLASGFPSSNLDGAIPYSALVLSSNVLYGTTYEGGTNGEGAVFSVQTDGAHFKELHSFSPLSSTFVGYNYDGAQPFSTLALSSNVLFGTTWQGGSNSSGSVFRINVDGSHFTNLYSFGYYAGSPKCGVIISSNVLYGTSSTGGASSSGSVFRLNIDGSHFTNIFNFSDSATNPAFGPTGGLILSGDTLYGTTAGGGTRAGGTIFSLSIDGHHYTNLFNFEYPDGGESRPSTNTTGGTPSASLVMVGQTLYGTTPHGGTNGNGVIFSINTDGSDFTVIHTFSPTTNTTDITNYDGLDPLCVLVAVGNTLYGTAGSGGPNGFGTIYSLNTDGSDFTTLWSFPVIIGTNYYDIDGDGPGAGVTISGSTIYGTSLNGGDAEGNIFALNISPTNALPTLGFQVNPNSLTLTWDSSNYILQYTGYLGSAFTNLPTATSPYTFTQFLFGEEFFRLVHK